MNYNMYTTMMELLENRYIRLALLLVTLTVFLSGCAPSEPNST